MSSTDPPKPPSTTARPSSKRISTVPTPPKPPTSIHPTAIIANHALLIGTHLITIGAHTVIHPYARIISTEGPVTIGDGCVIWEKATVGMMGGDSSSDGDEGVLETKLDDNVVIESCATVGMGAVLGDGCVVEGFGVVEGGATLGRRCQVQAFARVKAKEVLTEHTIVLGDGRRRVSKGCEGVERGREVAHEKMVRDFERVVPSVSVKWM
ncbi:hypothetical protein EJ08DRAFT_171969 [Tothia fuscella]|uniref:Dynactin subunit 6 n=1 Tax=Tothia fuscella TaxID=1048955 RepID=A0A9P4NUR9_9PEZI|nr:hypothetical protein EJ08DRAFT_171969 [Tothia fuscella]